MEHEISTYIKKETIESDFLNAQQLADKLGMSKKWIEKHVLQIPGRTKMGRLWRFKKSEIEKRLINGGQFLFDAPKKRCHERTPRIKFWNPTSGRSFVKGIHNEHH